MSPFPLFRDCIAPCDELRICYWGSTFRHRRLRFLTYRRAKEGEPESLTRLDIA
ncbi:hypothetical protein ACLEDV_00965 [Lonsdalea quercina]|uniref:hypothetical protein n=1 Tax=Lonsdalea quercina TaxID=71657 RepID=UPI00397625A5